MILRSKKRSNDTPPPSPEQRSPLVNVGSIPSADREPRASRSVTTNPNPNPDPDPDPDPDPTLTLTQP